MKYSSMQNRLIVKIGGNYILLRLYENYVIRLEREFGCYVQQTRRCIIKIIRGTFFQWKTFGVMMKPTDL